MPALPTTTEPLGSAVSGLGVLPPTTPRAAAEGDAPAEGSATPTGALHHPIHQLASTTILTGVGVDAGDAPPAAPGFAVFTPDAAAAAPSAEGGDGDAADGGDEAEGGGGGGGDDGWLEYKPPTPGEDSESDDEATEAQPEPADGAHLPLPLWPCS